MFTDLVAINAFAQRTESQTYEYNQLDNFWSSNVCFSQYI